MTNAIPNAPHVLKPCPFCGDTPELPDDAGTQYEIECGGCGQAMASVQICDLMTLEERVADAFTDYRYGEEFVERAKVEAIERWNTRAPSPAGVDGLEVVAYLIGGEPSLTPCRVRGVVNEPLCRLSDAQAIIDGLRVELRSLEEYAAGRMNKNHDLRQQLNRQAQRIGELEGLLREADYWLCVLRQDGGYSRTKELSTRIEAALSAGKVGE